MRVYRSETTIVVQMAARHVATASVGRVCSSGWPLPTQDRTALGNDLVGCCVVETVNWWWTSADVSGGMHVMGARRAPAVVSVRAGRDCG